MLMSILLNLAPLLSASNLICRNSCIGEVPVGKHTNKETIELHIDNSQENLGRARNSRRAPKC